MSDLGIGEMLAFQRELQAKYSKKWMDIAPENGHYSLLWAIGEIGEVIDLIKKRGSVALMEQPDQRDAFLEEFSDVLMYLMDMALCFGVQADELAAVYRRKAQRNLTRWD